ncbi:hypothetical protein [Gluconacetobacter takamatsuzukensis]|uniref:Uncharacterized protein n=1 Tax=Gluconacetobacter takamatsuzukensis TaxID=1286190 RepID=A0A7W4KC24_9PROT|nr:hypothetical protein [Gluconacetobacter takamatsuzukensis]MBB2204177.1 hypothetical protein [Gluconacetobacter takamatsuzukensis]
MMVRNGYKVRPTGLTTRNSGHMIFRIDDMRGQPRARIAAQDAPQALMLFWRRRGRQIMAESLPDPDPVATLRRNFDMARIRPDTAELPLPEPVRTAAQPAPRRPRTPRPVREATGQGQNDLFASPLPTAEPPAEPPKAEPPPPRRQVASLDAETLQLARVHYRGLQASDPADSYLYHITTDENAEAMLRDGLTMSRRHPLLLTERGGVPYWLSLVADDDDASEADIAVLRMKRFMIDDLIEDDPDSTRSSGSPSYFLTGNT